MLHFAQMRLADDSLHTVRIALREESLEVFKGLDHRVDTSFYLGGEPSDLARARR